MDKQQHIFIDYYKTPVGELILGSYNDQLCLADWRFRKMRLSIDQRIQKNLSAEYLEKSTPVIESAKKQLEQYFKGELNEFDLPLLLVGSDFQKTVWEALINIPFGQTQTYLGLSKKLGNVKAIRAVAFANGANAISIIVPCHRIIGSDNSLVGFAGGIPAKKKLLLLENPTWNNQMNLF